MTTDCYGTICDRDYVRYSPCASLNQLSVPLCLTSSPGRHSLMDLVSGLPDPLVSSGWVKPMAATGEEIRGKVEHDIVIFISLTSLQWASVTAHFLAVYSNCSFISSYEGVLMLLLLASAILLWFLLTTLLPAPMQTVPLLCFSIILFQVVICFLLGL